MLSADITGTSAADGRDVTRAPPSGVELVVETETAEAVVAVVVEALVVITEVVVAVAVVVAERIAVVVVK